MCDTRLYIYISLWALIILLGSYHSIHAASLWCFNGTIDNYQEATFTNSETLISSQCIDKNLGTVFYTFGFNGKTNGNATTNVTNAYLMDSIKRNVVLLNWEKEASPVAVLGIQLTNASYPTKVLFNAIRIGEEMGEVLINLSNHGLDLNNVMLVGHSLGAHLWGYCGRQVMARGKTIGRITGLDPASPLFEKNERIAEPLNRGSGNFVLCIHTDPGVYGINSSECSVDIWANYNHFINGDNLQPGCPKGNYTTLSPESLCSHNLSWQLLVDALLNNKTSLEASKASNYYAWAAANGTYNSTIYIGDLADSGASQGNYYLSTNPSAPYGKGTDGLRP